jgi:flagellar biosynthesis GTPase FlhF
LAYVRHYETHFTLLKSGKELWWPFHIGSFISNVSEETLRSKNNVYWSKVMFYDKQLQSEASTLERERKAERERAEKARREKEEAEQKERERREMEEREKQKVAQQKKPKMYPKNIGCTEYIQSNTMRCSQLKRLKPKALAVMATGRGAPEPSTLQPYIQQAHQVIRKGCIRTIIITNSMFNFWRSVGRGSQ